MAKPVLINGVDFTNYFTRTGYRVGYESVQGLNAGPMLNGSVQEDEVAIHAVVTLPCMPLNETQLSTLLDEVYRLTYPTLTYYDPRTKSVRTIQTRRSVSQQVYKGEGADQNEYWTGTVVTLTENPL